jgi:hypothetical protein
MQTSCQISISEIALVLMMQPELGAHAPQVDRNAGRCGGDWRSARILLDLHGRVQDIRNPGGELPQAALSRT